MNIEPDIHVQTTRVENPQERSIVHQVPQKRKCDIPPLSKDG
jgi:hypothetical protein